MVCSSDLRGAPANAVAEALVTVKLVPLTQRAAAR
jgi:hypothetical protein